jgi:hypothetical protein
MTGNRIGGVDQAARDPIVTDSCQAVPAPVHLRQLCAGQGGRLQWNTQIKH